jgi:GTP-binding protein
MMRIDSSSFVKSATTAQKVPTDLPTFALIGRSNVGKSSLINRLLQRKSLARTSIKPGKTQLVNYFLVNKAWYLVDLPGYGWAQVSKKKRLQWDKMVKSFLSQATINTLFVLLDSRHPLQKIDMEFLHWVAQAKLSYGIVLTKADKCKKREVITHVGLLQKTLTQANYPLPPLFVTSSKDQSKGHEEMLEYVEEQLNNLK